MAQARVLCEINILLSLWRRGICIFHIYEKSTREYIYSCVRESMYACVRESAYVYVRPYILPPLPSRLLNGGMQCTYL